MLLLMMMMMIHEEDNDADIVLLFLLMMRMMIAQKLENPKGSQDCTLVQQMPGHGIQRVEVQPTIVLQAETHHRPLNSFTISSAILGQESLCCSFVL